VKQGQPTVQLILLLISDRWARAIFTQTLSGEKETKIDQQQREHTRTKEEDEKKNKNKIEK
jgi:hypothetical protein